MSSPSDVSFAVGSGRFCVVIDKRWGPGGGGFAKKVVAVEEASAWCARAMAITPRESVTWDMLSVCVQSQSGAVWKPPVECKDVRSGATPI